MTESERSGQRAGGGFLKRLAINIREESCTVIAFTGGGGKTGLIFRLTDELTAAGKKVIVTTTAHMAAEPGRPFAENGNIRKVRENLDKHGYTLAACVDRETGKLCSLPEDSLKSLREHCDVLLIEADGSKRLPLKVPESWEPVIPACTDIVVGVEGLDSLGKMIGETAHRAERTAEFLGKTPGDIIAAEDLIKIASSEEGLRKGVANRQYRVYLNKIDVLSDPEIAEKICTELKKRGIAASCGSLRQSGQKPENERRAKVYEKQV